MMFARIWCFLVFAALIPHETEGLFDFMRASKSNDDTGRSDGFESFARASHKNGGIFVDVAGELQHERESCHEQCRVLVSGVDDGRDGSGKCGHCGKAGSCCRMGWGLEIEACEYGKSGGDQHVCVRSREPAAVQERHLGHIKQHHKQAAAGTVAQPAPTPSRSGMSVAAASAAAASAAAAAPSTPRAGGGTASSGAQTVWLPNLLTGKGLVEVSVADAVPTAISELGVLNASENAGSGRDVAGRWHAQAGQDRTAHQLLRKKRGGYFLDLAANEPVLLSNSRALERDFGFHGLCIEANPFYWAGLAQVRSNCTVVGAAVTSLRGEVTFRAFRSRGQSRNSGIVGRQQQQQAGSNGDGNGDSKEMRSTGLWYEFMVRTLPLAEILPALDVPAQIDFFSLDIEGAELLAMKTFPFAEYRFSVVSVERPPAELQRLLDRNGYEYLCDHGGFGDQMWYDALELKKGPASSISLEGVAVEKGIARTRFQDKTDAQDLNGKRCDLGFYTGLYGTHRIRASRGIGRNPAGGVLSPEAPQKNSTAAIAPAKTPAANYPYPPTSTTSSLPPAISSGIGSRVEERRQRRRNEKKQKAKANSKVSALG